VKLPLDDRNMAADLDDMGRLNLADVGGPVRGRADKTGFEAVPVLAACYTQNKHNNDAHHRTTVV